MSKCDFCHKYNPETKKCWWRLPTNRENDCKKAIKLMVSALKKER